MKIQVLCVALFAMQAVYAQDIEYLRSEFQQRHYQEILEPLASLRQSFGSRSSALTDETDYMLACALCALPQWRTDGCNYSYNLNAVLQVNGRSHQVPQEFATCCRQAGLRPPCAAGVKASADSDCAELSGKFDTKSRRDIIASVLKHGKPEVRAPVIGTPSGPPNQQPTYAAIAYSSDTGEWGTAWNYATLDAARSLALDSCGLPSCKVLIWTRFCAALATSREGIPGWDGGRSRWEAEASALRACNSNSHEECHIKCWVCTSR
jgi:hypothetical protein